jgi:hypothetical protein
MSYQAPRNASARRPHGHQPPTDPEPSRTIPKHPETTTERFCSPRQGRARAPRTDVDAVAGEQRLDALRRAWGVDGDTVQTPLRVFCVVRITNEIYEVASE